jgi:hypothetical protein
MKRYAVTLQSWGETVEVTVTEPEPRAGYYVSTQDRPAFVSELGADDFEAVFDLMRQDLDRSTETDGNGHTPQEPTSGSPEATEAADL